MPPEKMIEVGFSFVDGKHTQLPNLVLVPAGAKTFPVTVEWSIECEESHVIGSHHPDDAHQWCVLDGDLKQVMVGGADGGRRWPKKAQPIVSRTLHGGGASNPRQVTYQFTAAKLKHGVDYTLVASRHGLLAVGDFVAVREAKPRAVRKKVARKRKAAPKGKKRGARTKAKAPKARKASPKAKKAAARKPAA